MVKMTLFALCLMILTIVAASPYKQHLDRDWDLFQRRHGKNYDCVAKAAHRRDIWAKNLDIIKHHNIEYSQGFHTFTMGMNKYGDMTAAEFMHTLEGVHLDRNTTRRHVGYSQTKDLPDKVDWRQKGYVTGVKDQGTQGSSFAFSATGSIEGQMFNKTGKLVNLSEQNIIDCAGKESTVVSQGGLMDYAFQYVLDNGGLDSAECYPDRLDKRTCMYNPDCSAADVISYNDIVTGDEMALQQAVANVGPVSVAIDASLTTFQFYSSGIYDDAMCRSDRQYLDHGVLAVGYGTVDGKDFWIVKNSWGISWGQKGYIMMSRNKNNQCGIATAASYPLS